MTRFADVRICPVCEQPQRWCDEPSCASVGLPVGHWTHMTGAASAACPNLGDRNRDPALPPDSVWTRGEMP